MFGELQLSVRGASMVPCIFPGDVLTVRRKSTDEVQCGDVVLYSRGGRFYAHRVVRKTNESESIQLLTRGDALTGDDPPLLETELLGSVTAIARGARKIAPHRAGTSFSRLVQWGVCRCGAVTALLLLWHALRQRLAGNGTGFRAPEWCFTRCQ